MLEELRESWETLEQAQDADKAVLLKEMNKIARKSGKIRAFREMWLFDNQLEYQKLSELEDGYIDAMEGLWLSSDTKVGFQTRESRRWGVGV